ncbi:hypothetical protein FRC11_001501, partial [Ceratobasidium sp. 423]
MAGSLGAGRSTSLHLRDRDFSDHVLELRIPRWNALADWMGIESIDLSVRISTELWSILAQLPRLEKLDLRACDMSQRRMPIGGPTYPFPALKYLSLDQKEDDGAPFEEFIQSCVLSRLLFLEMNVIVNPEALDHTDVPWLGVPSYTTAFLRHLGSHAAELKKLTLWGNFITSSELIPSLSPLLPRLTKGLILIG